MSGRTARARRADPFTVPVAQRVDKLAVRVIEIEKRIGEVARAVPTEHTLRPMLLDIYSTECGQLEKLRDDAVRILTLLVTKGLVTQEELNAAIPPEAPR